MDSDQLIFVGFELTAQWQDRFADCNERDRDYLDNDTYLETVEIDGRHYIGKRVAGAIAVDRVEDMARSVVSLLRRVTDDWNVGPQKALVLAADQGGTHAL